jgi:hypothetical protein
MDGAGRIGVIGNSGGELEDAGAEGVDVGNACVDDAGR